MNLLKNLSLIIIALIAIYKTDIHSQSQWILKSTGCNLNSVFFIDEMTGYAAGDSGTVLATVDAGADWQCLFSGTSQSLKSIYFNNSLTGYAAGNGGVIIKTTNGGVNWTSLTTGTATNLTGIHFPTTDTGYAVGASLTLKTTNGGTSWTSIPANTGSSIFFSTGLKGLSTNNSHYLSKTSDGGSFWSINTAPGNPINQYANIFINENTGWTTGAGNKAYKTTNAGNNWVTQSNSATAFAVFYGIDFTDELNGCIAGYSGFFYGDSSMIYRTSNGGTNWTSMPTGLKKILRDVDFADEMNGWIVGDGGLILNTTDGGTTWKNQLIQYSSPFTQNMLLFDVVFRNEMTGWMCGMDGYVNKTTDGGISWNAITTASFNYLYSVCFPDYNDTGWVCGRSGTIQKTVNAGVNWVLQTTGTSQHLNSIVVDNFGLPATNIGWCVGNNGTILGYGLVWVALPSPTTNDLYSVFPLNANNGFIAGNAGTILKTTDSGLNWSIKTSGTTEDLKSIYFINSSTGYVCGTNGKIKITTDGGSVWTDQISGTFSTLYSIDFEETIPENGYAVGDNGTIVSTTNGGVTWLKESSGSTTPLYSVFVKEIPALSSTMTTAIKTVGKFIKYAVKKPVEALSVELTSLNYLINDNTVTLIWQTSGEINNRGFEVERKPTEGIKWTKIGFTEGHGTQNNLNDYSFSDRNLNSGKYNYRLKQTDLNGNFEYFNLISEVIISAPDKFELKQNYPNPFNPVTHLEFGISNMGLVSLIVYDISGKEVRTLVNEIKEAGYYSVKFNGSDLSSGIYFYKLQYAGKEVTKKMLLLK